MFSVTPETHLLLNMFISVAAFLIAQIITHPGTDRRRKESAERVTKVAPV